MDELTIPSFVTLPCGHGAYWLTDVAAYCCQECEFAVHRSAVIGETEFKCGKVLEAEELNR
jgi:hypothetical protein